VKRLLERISGQEASGENEWIIKYSLHDGNRYRSALEAVLNKRCRSGDSTRFWTPVPLRFVSHAACLISVRLPRRAIGQGVLLATERVNTDARARRPIE
jgi:hypothetical protein